jgi:DNA-binding GntR family transcriptional regulator
MQSFFDRIDPDSFSQPRSLWMKVLEFLRDAIVKGNIRPGERLNEVLIASSLGVSRSPVREAIRVLESEKFVETIDRKGTFVKPLSLREIEEISVVLKILQVAAIKLAVTNLNENRKRDLTAIIAQLEEGKSKKNLEELKSMSRRFHSFIMRASDNEILIRINEALLVQQERVRLWGASTEPADIEAIYNEHISISKAILNEDAEEAGRLMEDHVEKARIRLRKAIEKVQGS